MNTLKLKQELKQCSSSVRMDQARCVCLITQTENTFLVLFASLSSGWATTTDRLLDPNRK